MRLSGTKTSTISTSRGLGNQLYDLAGERPSLDLHFSDQKSLVDAATGSQPVTFTRASSGTYVDSQGVIRTATTNLLVRSEEFDNASWTKQGSTVTSNAIIAPNGTASADKIVEDTNTGFHRIYQTPSTSAGAVTLSFYAKAAERSWCFVRMNDGSNVARNAYFDISTGAVGSAEAGYTTSIEAVGNGWFRCVATLSGNTSGAIFSMGIATADAASLSYTGNGTSGIYLWGAQLEQSSTVGEYIPTTSTINSAPRFDHNPTTGESLGLLVEEQRTNLLLRSEEFDNASWVKAATTVTANQGVAPDGQSTADKLIENTSNAYHQLYQSFASAVSTAYTFTVYAKAAGRNLLILAFNGTAITSGQVYSYFNLSTGAVATNVGATSPSITAVGNGWYRCSISTTTLSSAGIANAYLTTSQDSGNTLYAGDGTSGYLIWGSVVEAGSFPTSYIPTTTAAVTRSADVASISGSNFGTFRTNLLLRSEEFDNASWTKFNSSIVANALAAPNGTTTGDKIIESADNSVHIATQNATVSSGATATISLYAKAAERSQIILWIQNSGDRTFAKFNLSTESYSSGALGTGVFSSASIQPVGNGWYRISLTGSLGGRTLYQIQIGIVDASGNESYTGDGTSGIYIWGAQLETGSTATAVIPTTTAAVTVFESSWYRQDEGTVFAETQLATNRNYSGTFRHLMQATPASNNDSAVGLFVNSANQFSLQVRNNNANQAVIDTGTNSGLTHRVAGVYKVDDFAISANGGSAAVDISGSAPTTTAISQMTIGGVRDGNTLGILNGTIRRLTYFPARLPNSTLQQITQ